MNATHAATEQHIGYERVAGGTNVFVPTDEGYQLLGKARKVHGRWYLDTGSEIIEAATIWEAVRDWQKKEINNGAENATG